MRRALVVERPGPDRRSSSASRLAARARRGRRSARRTAASAAPTSSCCDGSSIPAFVRYPLTLGHEWSGVVEAVGDGRHGHRAGRSRASPSASSRAGTARRCRAGATNVCDDLRRARLHARGRRERPGRRAGAGRARARAGRAAARRRARRADVRRHARAREGRARARASACSWSATARSRCSRRTSPALWSPAEIVVLGRRPEQAAARARPSGATGFTTDDGVAEGFDLVIEAAGATGGDAARGRAPPGAAAACCCSACRRPGRCSSCRPTCS